MYTSLIKCLKTNNLSSPPSAVTYLIHPCLYLTTLSMKSSGHHQTRRQSSVNSGCQERPKPSVSAWLSMTISRQSVKHEERNVSLDSYCSVRASPVSMILILPAIFSVEQMAGCTGKSTTLRRKRLFSSTFMMVNMITRISTTLHTNGFSRGEDSMARRHPT